MAEESQPDANTTPTPAEPVQPPAAPSTPPVQPKKSSSTLVIVIILGVLLVCCVACALIAGFTVWSSSNSSSSSDSEDGSSSEDFNWDEFWSEFEDSGEEDGMGGSSDTDGTDETTTTSFTGTYVTAELPEGWTIVEYTDGEGSDMLVEQPYTGLTGLKVFTPDSVEAFSLRAVDGIGGIDACGEYYQFPDDNPSYLSDMQDLATDVGMDLTITPFGAGDYTEFELFGIPVRRVGYDLYKDRYPGNEFFEAACGINEFMQIDQLTFTGGSYESHTYGESIGGLLNNGELLTLDGILASIEGY
jgi:hypothetical protein